MSLVRLTLAALAVIAVLVAAGCGGGDQTVPEDAVAVVGGTPITKAELDEFLSFAEKGYEASKQEFPKAGTPEYQSLQTQWVGYLVQREELRQAAGELGIEVTEKDVDKAENELIASRFDGKRAEYEKALKQQGFTSADYRTVLETSALETKIFNEVTKDVEVGEKDVLDYYTANQSLYPESRDVRHILIAVKDDKDKVDYEASKKKAEEIYAELKAGADFASLAKANSDDPGSKDSGGKLTISKGQTVPEFEAVAFALEKGEISKPVATQYGYHVIQALTPVRKTNLDNVKDTIRAQLLQQKRNEAMGAWVEDLTKDYEGKVSYAEGFEPPELPEVPTTATE
jgi:parvulin-like peptidyl-prolyl isomerase